MSNIQIAKVCGLCAGCNRAVNTVVNEIKNGERVTIFKEIVHNKNVNKYLENIGAKCENEIENLTNDTVIIIRAHGEPPETYKIFEERGIKYRDCTCVNVEKIHKAVAEYSEKGYRIIIIGKHKNTMHPEVFGTIGWAGNNVILIESEEDFYQIQSIENEKFYLVCQTTFNLTKAEELIDKIEKIAKSNNCEIIINKSICEAQKIINEYSVRLAKESDVMIVVGGLNSSNSYELYKNVNSICPSIFIEDINSYKSALNEKGIIIDKDTKIGLTAGASTRKEELIELKEIIIKDLDKTN